MFETFLWRMYRSINKRRPPNKGAGRRDTWFAYYVITVVLLASTSSCIAYDEGFDSRSTGASSNPGADNIVISNPCDNSLEAIIRVREFDYSIQCGCEEEPWSENASDGSTTCTVPVGTTVVWQFIGSESHTVSSADSSFGNSDTQINGTHEMTFGETGEYPYFCARHPGPMSGYTVVVR